jgi:folylpolyglutamate synthase
MSSSPPIKDYNSAVAALYSPLHQSTTPETINAASARRTNTIHDMNTYLYRIGLDLNNNNNDTDGRQQKHYTPPLIIHITGTKGKGSTLSYCESLLRNVYKLHTGMFTSPHLVSITERIRINGQPVSTEVFGKVYWTVRELLEKNCHQHVMLSKSNDYDHDNNNDSKGENNELLPPLPILPGYFRMLTLMAIYTFCYIDIPNKVDVILLEVGMGGRYDATNIFESNNINNNDRVLVQGITLIDYDHTRILGSTLEQIAWEKGGIFVTNKICNVGKDDGGYTKFLTEHYHPQEQEKEATNANSNSSNILFVNGNNTPQVSNVLRTIAHKENGQLQLINHNNTTDSSTLFSSLSNLLQFHAKYQYDNAALALAICQYAMKQYYCKHNNNNSKRMICPTNEVGMKQQLDREDGTYYNENVIAMALNNTFWPGRCHTLIVPPASSSATGATGGKDEKEVVESTMKLRCDGAHTPISINACIRWFQSIIKSYDDKEEEDDVAKEVLKVLIFNCGHERNPIPLLYSLHKSGLFDCVYFCRADFERPSALPKKLLDEWLTEPLLLNGQQNDEKDGDVTLTYQAMCNEVAKVVQRDGDDDDNTNKKSITWQETLANIWRIMDLYHYSQLAAERKKSSLPTSYEENINIDDDKRKVAVGLKVADAMRQVQNEQQHEAQEDHDNGDSVVEILVTGSLYLVGSALEAVGWKETESEGVLLHSI